MIEKNLSQIEKMANGYGLKDKYKDINIKGVSTDTRDIIDNNLFIPLIGDNFNGHDFIDTAIKNGATAALWQKDMDLPDIDFPFILVEDTLIALQDLAANYRDSLKDIKIIGITGSNGKTTTKDILDGILSTKYKTKKTKGNLNNHIGLPLTLLDLDNDTEISILEMGTDGFGQIELLTNIAKPDMAMITNIGLSHLDLLKTKDNVARAKFEILKGINKNGLFTYNGDDNILNKIIKEYDIEQDIIKFGQNDNNNIIIRLLDEGIDGIDFIIIENNKEYKLHIPMLGRHNIYNAAASIVIGRRLNIDYKDIQKGLYNIDSTEMRNDIIKTDDYTILNDAYKSNPDSLLAALNTLYSIDGYKNKAVVLGDMLDLGEDIVQIHKDIGPKIDPDKVDQIFTIGDLGKYIGESAQDNFNSKDIYHADNKEDLVDLIKENINKDSIILIKASRGVALEDVIDKLVKD